MSKLSTITILGTYRTSPAVGTLDFVQRNAGFVDFEGFVNGGVVIDDDFEVVRIPVKDSDPFDVVLQALSGARITQFDCGVTLDGETRFLCFNLRYAGSLEITLLSNRKALIDGTTDFTWYYTNVVSALNQTVIQVHSVEFFETM